MLIYYFLVFFIIFVYLFGLILGEKIVSSNEHTRFAKWWRKHICSPDPHDQ